jgi:hypothetical protein
MFERAERLVHRAADRAEAAEEEARAAPPQDPDVSIAPPAATGKRAEPPRPHAAQAVPRAPNPFPAPVSRAPSAAHEEVVALLEGGEDGPDFSEDGPEFDGEDDGEDGPTSFEQAMALVDAGEDAALMPGAPYAVLLVQDRQNQDAVIAAAADPEPDELRRFKLARRIEQHVTDARRHRTPWPAIIAAVEHITGRPLDRAALPKRLHATGPP